MTDQNQNNENKIKVKLEQLKEKGKAFFSRFQGTGKFLSRNKKNIIVCASVLVICGAVYLNYSLFGNTNKTKTPTPSAPSDSANTVNENDEYFASAVLSRQKARDEAMEVLQQVVDSSDAVETIKNEAYSGINTIAKEIESESNIEQLVMAKGFEQCLAVVNDGSASVIVKSDGLLANEIAQIKEIVYEQSGVHPRDIKIIEKS